MEEYKKEEAHMKEKLDRLEQEVRARITGENEGRYSRCFIPSPTRVRTFLDPICHAVKSGNEYVLRIDKHHTHLDADPDLIAGND
eukprot:840991-Rhodomonas_salina.3